LFATKFRNISFLVQSLSMENRIEDILKLPQQHALEIPTKRPSWDEYFMQMAFVAKLRSTCATRQTGAALVKDKRLVATGYNGSPMGVKHCNEGGCPRCLERLRGEVKSGDFTKANCICVHAEENTILQAAFHGVSTRNSIMYTTFYPCASCARMIINAGVMKVVVYADYPDEQGKRLLNEAGIHVVNYQDLPNVNPLH
jgi:dCMP deaminase